MKKSLLEIAAEEHPFSYELHGEVLYLREKLVLDTVNRFFPELQRALSRFSGNSLQIDLSGLQQADSAGITSLNLLTGDLARRGVSVNIAHASPEVARVLQTFTAPAPRILPKARPVGTLQRLGEIAHNFLFKDCPSFLLLMADICFWSATDIFGSRAHRKGEFINQSVLIGVNALPIIALVTFLIGLVMALQSAQQLRQFGAHMFVADLVVIAMTREMGPLLSAIMIAGRSGSAIASEIATMVVTEEVDALHTMALDPRRYIVVPKMHASLFTLPLLTLFADFFGILGGMFIGYLYLDITPAIFYNRMAEVLFFRDILTGVVKSFVFAVLIVIASSYYGFRAQRGAEQVGKITTQAVVAAIFLVILADSLLGLLFY